VVRVAEVIGRTLLIIRYAVDVAATYPYAEGRLPESLHFAESDVILGVVRARSVHKIGYGHNCDWAAA
jgi:hypothetical protein